jgi:hypothetical protein
MVCPLLVDKLTNAALSGVDRLERPAIELASHPYFGSINVAVDKKTFVVDCEHGSGFQ